MTIKVSIQFNSMFFFSTKCTSVWVFTTFLYRPTFIFSLWLLTLNFIIVFYILWKQIRVKNQFIFHFFYLDLFFLNTFLCKCSPIFSWRLKWAFLIKICPLSVVVVVVIFSHFHLLQNRWANLNQTWQIASLGEGDSSLFKWRANSFPRGDYYEIAKIHWQIWKIIISRTTGPI